MLDLRRFTLCATLSATLAAAFAGIATPALALPQDCADCDDNGIAESDEQSAPGGLAGQYFRSQGSGNFTERLAARIDGTIDFNWAGNAPLPDFPSNDFAVRWTGTLVAPATGNYTFFTTTDDGVRLWVGGQLRIDKWQPQSSLTWSATVPLVAGQRYAIRMDYYEGGGDAVARLEWTPPGGVRAVVPTSVLEPSNDLDGDGWPDSCEDCNGNGTIDTAEILAGAAQDCNGNCIPDSCELAQSATLAYWRMEDPSTTVVDSGPSQLDGVPTGVTLGTETPVARVPATAALDAGVAEFGATGRVLVNDTAGVLDSQGDAFTIEAWVRLDERAAAADAAGRQVLVQRKPLASGDKFADYLFFVQGGDMPTQGIANYGRTSGFNGRELVLAFGNGGTASASFWTVTSTFRIEDDAWHFVAVAFDPKRGEVRFTLDAQTEYASFVDRGRWATPAPVLIGAHTNAAGTFNQFVKGAVDELRLSAGVVDPGLLLARPGSADCNGNGTPDGCDISSGASGDCNRDGIPDECEPDCNGNGIADGCDLASGSSTDCNEDGIPDDCQIDGNDCDSNGVPDECELAANDCNANGRLDGCEIADGSATDCDANGTIDACELGEPLNYRIDDGGPEFGIRGAGDRMAWLTQFTVEQGAGTIESIDMMFVFAGNNQPVDLYLWSDPNNDGDPTDAQVLASKATTVGLLGVLQNFDIPDTEVGPNGTSFFIGAIIATSTNSFPGPLDTSGSAVLGRCWIVGKDSAIDPNDLAAGALEFKTIEEALFPGKWVMRANAKTNAFDCNENGILDRCDIASGTSADADRSGRPDECEDCNGNGVLDSSDIAAGTSADCQEDGIPDECQLLGGDCNGNGLPDACELAGNDCNGNGRLDACDLASGASADTDGTGIPDECEDCNANGVLDSADIAGGVSDDCQPDGIPDECQLGEPDYPVGYALDDGTRDGNYGFGGIADVLWMNQFATAKGGETIGRIDVILGNAFAGVEYRVGLWSDPNGDGVPDDAQLIATAPAVSENGNTNIFNEIAIAPTYIGPAGTSFFAGILYRDDFGNQFPVAVDLSQTDLRSWVAAGPTVDPNNLSAATVYGYFTQADGLVRAKGFDGVLPDDCNGNGVPDSCDIADGTLADSDGDGVPDCCSAPRGCGACAVDLTGDGVVDAADITAMLLAWGTAQGDVNGDGLTDASDLAALLIGWGPCR